MPDRRPSRTVPMGSRRPAPRKCRPRRIQARQQILRPSRISRRSRRVPRRPAPRKCRPRRIQARQQSCGHLASAADRDARRADHSRRTANSANAAGAGASRAARHPQRSHRCRTGRHLAGVPRDQPRPRGEPCHRYTSAARRACAGADDRAPGGGSGATAGGACRASPSGAGPCRADARGEPSFATAARSRCATARTRRRPRCATTAGARSRHRPRQRPSMPRHRRQLIRHRRPRQRRKMNTRNRGNRSACTGIGDCVGCRRMRCDASISWHYGTRHVSGAAAHARRRHPFGARHP